MIFDIVTRDFSELDVMISGLNGGYLSLALWRKNESRVAF